METIFDYNPTEQELKRFGGPLLTKKENYMAYISEDGALFNIGELFLIRGDKEKAYSYFNRVKDKSLLNVLIADF